MRGRAAFGNAHGLLDDHEAARQQAHTGHPICIGFKLLLDPRRNFGVLCNKSVCDFRGGGHAQESCGLEFPRQEQVVGAASAHHDPGACPIDFLIALHRRIVSNQVGAFDDDIRRRVVHVRCPHRINGDERQIDLARLHRLHHTARRIEQHQLDRHAKAATGLCCKVYGDAARFSARAADREDGIAEIDGGAKFAGRSKFSDRPARVSGAWLAQPITAAAESAISQRSLVLIEHLPDDAC